MMKEFKDKSLLQITDNGTVEAVFSVFNEIDSDNDVVLPNAIRSGYGEKGVVMCWGHDWKQIIGKGKIVTDENKATFKGKFNMTTNAGKEAYETVKAMEDMQQWSFGFEVNDSEMGSFTKDSGESQEVRYLKDVKVWEVSPVMVGANQNTYTLAIKEAKEQDEIIEQEENKDLGLRFTDEVDNLLIKMTALLKRSKELTALRLSKNKTLSEGSIDELEKLKDALQDMHQDIDTLLSVGTDDEAQVMVADDHYEEVNDLFRETNELLNDTLMIDLGEINE
tara:strand:- start:3935 stop:4771 length:837 start_codon:yes stop_codon:yes gene_type:complete